MAILYPNFSLSIVNFSANLHPGPFSGTTTFVGPVLFLNCHPFGCAQHDKRGWVPHKNQPHTPFSRPPSDNLAATPAQPSCPEREMSYNTTVGGNGGGRIHPSVPLTTILPVFFLTVVQHASNIVEYISSRGRTRLKNRSRSCGRMQSTCEMVHGDGHLSLSQTVVELQRHCEVAAASEFQLSTVLLALTAAPVDLA